MLQPTSRMTLIDAMRPPAGFTLDAAMGVTFTLDLRALLAAPAAFALSGADAVGDQDNGPEPIELLHALRAHAGKLTVLSQTGEIALPPSRKAFSFLEQVVVPVSAPRHGVVHPKVWVLRYTAGTSPTDGSADRVLRVLIGSRNLTFDASWDTLVRFDERPGGDGADLSPVGTLFTGLLPTAAIPVADAHRDRINGLAADLEGARFAVPEGIDSVAIHVLGLETTVSPLPARADRSLIISPFLGDDFFRGPGPERVDELVSRPQSLDGLSGDARRKIIKAYTFDDPVLPESAAPDGATLRDPGRPLIGLHAKVFAFENGSRAQLFLGSANATGAAFGSNVEILAEFAGAREAVGIDRLCGPVGEDRGLRWLFEAYTPGDDADVDETSTGLDAARRRIAQLELAGEVFEGPDGWSVEYRSTEPLPEPGDATLECWPLASPGNRRRISSGEPLFERFETTVEAISRFLAVEIRSDDYLTSFVVPVPLVGVPEQRDRALLRALVGNAERFFRYLLALLDDDREGGGLLDVLADEAPDADGSGYAGASLPVLEKLLRTMRSDPAKLEALHPLVVDLAADGALPEGFEEVWGVVRAVGLFGGTS